MLPFAPGARAVIRDEEWLIRRVDPSTDGGWLLTCDGISHLVRSQSALFLTELEDDIEVLDPAKTLLVPVGREPQAHYQPGHRRHADGDVRERGAAGCITRRALGTSVQAGRGVDSSNCRPRITAPIWEVG